MQESLPRILEIEVVAPQRKHIRRADINSAIDQVLPDLELLVRRKELRVDGYDVCTVAVGHLLEVQAAVFGGVDDEDGVYALGFCSVIWSRFSQDHGHDGVFVFGAAGSVGG
jgi:hypothetical protein